MFLPRNVFLSSQGYVKTYIYHLTTSNKHFLYYHLINNQRDMHLYLPIPPECLPYWKKRAYSMPDVDYEAMDIFGIGMILL